MSCIRESMSWEREGENECDVVMFLHLLFIVVVLRRVVMSYREVLFSCICDCVLIKNKQKKKNKVYRVIYLNLCVFFLLM